MMSVISLGMATGTPAKTAAYAELSQLTQLLFRDATWAKLNEKVLTKIAQQFANKFSVGLTKKPRPVRPGCWSACRRRAQLRAH